MPAAYSTDRRQRIVDAYQAQEGSQRELANCFKVSLSFVRDLMRHYRQSGNVKPKAHGGGIAAKITTEQLSIVDQLWKQHNDALLYELCEHSSKELGLR